MNSPWDKRPPRNPPVRNPPVRDQEARDRPARDPEARNPPARHPRAGAERSHRHAPSQREAQAAVPATARSEVRLYGLNAVDAVFRRRPEAIRKVYLLESRIPALKPLLAWCVKHRVGYRVVEDGDLERLAASSHHEGVVADVLRVEPQPLDGWLQGLGPAALAIWLDGVGNPHNFGAILRTAAHFGAAVLLPAGSSLALSGAAARVAEGGAEAVPLVRLPSTGDAIARLHAAGFELDATVVRGGEDLFAARLPKRLVYVMGAEGEGMDAALAAACDRRLSIPGSGAVESLNVAAATAVFLSRWAARDTV